MQDSYFQFSHTKSFFLPPASPAANRQEMLKDCPDYGQRGM
ncbi:hypothetical protein HMPREF9141_0721 [Prevotella multiformis DSM 16608]|uniref:Uncharacterized protein n=1 Tax=Prevotella multiformis DSM 16608 TaxID=888743 RepID=F0F555_9BACT|nr:hypothetical protein HMPREF9141_0721 [Prevotella multiformis DSM 16608]